MTPAALHADLGLRGSLAGRVEMGRHPRADRQARGPHDLWSRGEELIRRVPGNHRSRQRACRRHRRGGRVLAFRETGRCRFGTAAGIAASAMCLAPPRRAGLFMAYDGSSTREGRSNRTTTIPASLARPREHGGAAITPAAPVPTCRHGFHPTTHSPRRGTPAAVDDEEVRLPLCRSPAVLPVVDGPQWEDLERVRQDSRRLGVEGLRFSAALVCIHGREKTWDWWKWKIDSAHD